MSSTVEVGNVASQAIVIDPNTYLILLKVAAIILVINLAMSAIAIVGGVGKKRFAVPSIISCVMTALSFASYKHILAKYVEDYKNTFMLQRACSILAIVVNVMIGILIIALIIRGKIKKSKEELHNGKENS